MFPKGKTAHVQAKSISTKCIDYVYVYVFDGGRLLDTLQILPGSKQEEYKKGKKRLNLIANKISVIFV